MRPRISRPSPALVLAGISLAVALGGTSYAAFSVPPNSVGTTALKNDAVVSTKVRNGSLLKVDFKAGQLPAGPKGAQGAPGAGGPQGPPGTAGTTGPTGAGATALWAVVRADGTPARSKGTESTSRVGTGSYNVVFSQDVTGCSEIAMIGPATTGTEAGDIDAASLLANPAGIYVETRSNTGTLQDHSFHIAVFC
jgi:hypothetical protein